MKQLERKVVRALIVSPESSILLAKIQLGDKSFWITPGGGVEAQEDIHTALKRVLTDEIGQQDWEIGPAVWARSHTFDFEGETLTQHELFHWVACDWFVPPEAMPNARENQYFGGFKWWTASELLESKDIFAPRQLAKYFDELIKLGIPDGPIDVGV